MSRFAGVRRVEALVGVDAYSFLAREHILLDSISDLMKATRAEELPEKISQLLSRVKEVEKELNQFKTKQALSDSASLVSKAEKIGQVSLVANELSPGLSGDDLRVIALDLRSKIPNSVIALASKNSEKVVVVVAVDDLARNLEIKAGALAKLASTVLGGGGGGKDDFAQGGGIDLGKVGQALAAIKESIQQS